MSAHPHIAPKSMYYLVFLALVAGTIATYFAALVDMGALNNIVMLTIAVAKATLVVLFFMHLRWGTNLTKLVAVSGLFWLLIMFSITMSDFLTRGWVPGTLR